MRVYACTLVEVKGQYAKLVLLFHHVGPTEPIQVISLRGKPTEPLLPTLFTGTGVLQPHTEAQASLNFVVGLWN